MTKIIELKDSSRLAVETPYNAGFVSELKRRVPAARWNRPYWTFPAEARATVEEIVAKYFPPETAKRRYRVRFQGLERESGPVLAGMPLVDYGRDGHRFRHPDIIEVVEDNLRAGGSRRNPHISGDFEVIVKATPEAVAEMVAGWGEKVQVEDLDAQALPPTREVAGLTFWAENDADAVRPLHQAPQSSDKFAALLLAEAEKLEALAAAYRQRAEAMQGEDDAPAEGVRKVVEDETNA